MDFALTEEQQDIRSLAQQILGDKSSPERLRELEKHDAFYDSDAWAALAEAGLLGVGFDETWGGMGFDFESLCVVLEEAGRTVAKVPLLPVLVGAALPMQRFAGEAPKQRWLGDVISGKRLLTGARIEPGNENPLAPATRAEKSGDGLAVTGCKQCVPLAETAAGIVLAARADDGLAVVLVQPDQPGITLTPQQVTTGETYFQVALDNVAVSGENILARGDDAEAWVRWTEQHYQTALCAMAVGLCDKMMRMTGSYTSEREQFGRPVATFQAVAHRMADCYIDVECLRLVTAQAVYRLVNARDDAAEAVLTAKAWCGDVTHRVSQAAQHCHGGIGVDRDYPLFRYCLWAREIELTAGTTAQLTETLGREIAASAA